MKTYENVKKQIKQTKNKKEDRWLKKFTKEIRQSSEKKIVNSKKKVDKLKEDMIEPIKPVICNHVHCQTKNNWCWLEEE